MAKTFPIEMNSTADNSHDFHPMRGMSNCHLQTMLPRLIRRELQFTPYWQRLDLPDGDFVDLAWSENPAQAAHKPRLVVFHGLEGSLYSPYVHGIIHTVMQRGWLGVVMHFRGCSGVPNRNRRIYHSGEIEDGRWFLHWLRREFGTVPTAAVGYSLGGNMLACLLAAEGNNVPLDTAAIVSAPLMLEACSYHMDKGFARLYQYYLLHLLKANATRKLKAWPGSLPVDLHQLKAMRSIRDFDDMITARIHGFTDALDYYRQCSAMPRLNSITIPTLIIHAKDDPFMDHHSIPSAQQIPANVEYQLTVHGGHVGFVGGTLSKPEMWLEQRIPDWLNRWSGVTT
ncbi:hydrolase [Enterobacteriaceae bacterium ESL0689]|nr:hydrolase [Enterobacteriaceae bacterium ESL0689]